MKRTSTTTNEKTKRDSLLKIDNDNIENLKMLRSNDYAEKLVNVVNTLHNCIENGGKILICGNGGSAADAQHIAAEFTWRYKTERKSLPAIALTTDTSALTAIGNDYWFDQVFSRQLEWLWNEWDVLIWISTSWNSENVIKAVEMAKSMWIKTVWLLGKWWWKLKDMMDYALVVPSDNTPRIQECHMTIYHSICELIDILDQERNQWQK